MDLTYWKQLKFSGLHLNSLACKCVALVVTILVFRTIISSKFLGFGAAERKNLLNTYLNVTNVTTSSEQIVTKERFLEVPQIIWGLNNQKIAFARACLTARMLNRTLLMPSLSASLFYKEVDQLQPISFDKVFNFETFNSLCHGFLQLARYSDGTNQNDVFEMQKGSGRRWTVERDLDQLMHFSKHPYDGYETIQIVGKNPFLWHDHWPVKDYAKIFECLVFVDEILQEADKVVSKIRETGHIPEQSQNVVNTDNLISQQVPYVAVHMRIEKVPYVAVHMRIEKDWMIHCKKLEQRLNTTEICSSKKQILERVQNIKGLSNPTAVYIAVADSLLEDTSILDGWGDGLIPTEKKRLGMVDLYNKHPYLIKSAIDYLVCLQSDIFVGNSFSTFSSLVVLDRTQKMISLGDAKKCGAGARWPSYAYNVEGDDLDGPRPWATDMSESSLQSISYGTNHVSC